MKIDLHVHTKKIKSGDAISRNVEYEKFIEILKNSEVKILAITNHNHFDLVQFEKFRDGVLEFCQIWPGVELDVLENGKRAHLIVICNPNNSIKFSEKIIKILSTQNPDIFTTTIDEVVKNFDELDCVYVAHYFSKKPCLGDEEIQYLSDNVYNNKRIIKEATNSISAGIYISHGHNSIYGSDVQNWDDYLELSMELPELRLPVESFEQFCLLLEKDESTINTLLDRKYKENIELNPFKNAAEIIRLDIFNDINILFGSKGTGKTDILEALSKYYNSIGHKTLVYKSNEKHLNDVYDIKGNTINCDVEEFGIDDCVKEIKFLREVTEAGVTSVGKYYLHFSTEELNKISKSIKIHKIKEQDVTISTRNLEELVELNQNIDSFINDVQEKSIFSKFVQNDLKEQLTIVLKKISTSLHEQSEFVYIDKKSSEMLNGISSVFRTEISKKTGRPSMPTKTGFSEFARNRIKIENAVKKILHSINIKISSIQESVGSLGEKGELKCITNLMFHDGNSTDINFTPIKNIKKTPQKNFVHHVNLISNHIYSNDLFAKISELNEFDGNELINSLSDLLLKHRHFMINEKYYSPSHGESSMILLYKELLEDKDIYIIDEPEKSLGNDYINDVIVPLLKVKATLGKKVVIATHDANIAVRTLPYNSIFRQHDEGQYLTYTGNPFINKLKCLNKSKVDLDWKEISMKTLEGGKDAFAERGTIYGN